MILELNNCRCGNRGYDSSDFPWRPSVEPVLCRNLCEILRGTRENVFKCLVGIEPRYGVVRTGRGKTRSSSPSIAIGHRHSAFLRLGRAAYSESSHLACTILSPTLLQAGSSNILMLKVLRDKVTPQHKQSVYPKTSSLPIDALRIRTVLNTGTPTWVTFSCNQTDFGHTILREEAHHMVMWKASGSGNTKEIQQRLLSKDGEALSGELRKSPTHRKSTASILSGALYYL
ncbi:uncharacterized protein EV420DRAFT_1570985, partial [Desarmillaria tabescens]